MHGRGNYSPRNDEKMKSTETEAGGLRVDVVDMTSNRLLADYFCPRETAECIIRHSGWIRKKKIAISNGTDYVEIAIGNRRLSRLTISGVKRFLEFATLSEVVLEFIQVMALMMSDKAVGSSEPRDYDAILSDILVDGGVCLNDLTGDSSSAILELVRTLDAFEAPVLKGIALKLLALLVSAPDEVQWSEKDESDVWKILNADEARIVRRMVLELPWCNAPEGKRYRAARGLRKEWDRKLASDVERNLDHLLRVLEGTDVNVTASALLKSACVRGDQDGVVRFSTSSDLWQATRAVGSFARNLLLPQRPRLTPAHSRIGDRPSHGERRGYGRRDRILQSLNARIAVRVRSPVDGYVSSPTLSDASSSSPATHEIRDSSVPKSGRGRMILLSQPRRQRRERKENKNPSATTRRREPILSRQSKARPDGRVLETSPAAPPRRQDGDRRIDSRQRKRWR